MANKNELYRVINEVTERIEQLNDAFFEAVMDIYSANFNHAKLTFLKTVEFLDPILRNGQILNQHFENRIYLDTAKVSELLETGILYFEKTDYQGVADLLNYDFSVLLNDYHDELKSLL